MITLQRCLFVISCMVFISLPVQAAEAPIDNPGFQMIHKGYGLSLHKEMYMMPLTYSNKYHGIKSEAVFQLSAKHQIFKTSLYFGYTQISFWQAYDSKHSAPFRETNYNPELFYRLKGYQFLGDNWGADIGVEHESNGQIQPVSRSWNLLHFSPFYYQPNLLLYLKFRYRLPEDKKESPDSAVGDDNPDITDYLGYNDLHAYYKFFQHHMIHLVLRGNLNTGKGCVAVNYSFLIPTGKVSYLNFRIFHGYGESLVDYNEKLTRIGAGLMFAR